MTLNLVIEFDGDKITLTCDKKVTWICPKNLTIITETDSFIIVKLEKTKGFDLNNAIVQENFYCGKGTQILPAPQMNNILEIRTTYRVMKSMIISGIGLLDNDSSYTIVERLPNPYRRFYYLTNNYTKYGNIYIVYAPSTEKRFDDQIVKIDNFINKCNNLFGITDNKIYTVNMIETHLDMAGGYADIYCGTFIYYNRNSEKSMKLVKKSVIYHELFHNFNPGFGLKNRSYEIMWFREGFCDYFYRYILYNNDEDKFNRDREIFRHNYITNPYINLSNEAIVAKIEENFNNNAARNMQYYQGFVYADYLRKTKGTVFIDKYIRLINAFLVGNKKYDNDEIGKYFDESTFEKYIIEGHTIPIK